MIRDHRTNEDQSRQERYEYNSAMKIVEILARGRQASGAPEHLRITFEIPWLTAQEIVRGGKFSDTSMNNLMTALLALPNAPQDKYLNPDKMAAQSEEFDAMREMAKQWRRITMTPIVDDDYPEVRHDYECAVRTFLEKCRANGRRFGG